MFRLLSDAEVALNELLVACRESIDHYQDAVQLADKPQLAKTFDGIARERKLFLPQLESAIRELGDLPSVPDPDKEAGVMAMHHLGAAIADDYADELIAQRIDAEKNILTLITSAQTVETNQSCKTLLANLAEHISVSVRLLENFSANINESGD